MTIGEHAAYLRGLAEGLELDTDRKEVKLLNAIIDVIGEIAVDVADNTDEIGLLNQAVGSATESIDVLFEAVDNIENDIYGDIDDEDYDDTDGDVYEMECPECGNIFTFDDSVFDEDGTPSIECPYCGCGIDEIEIVEE